MQPGHNSPSLRYSASLTEPQPYIFGSDVHANVSQSKKILRNFIKNIQCFLYIKKFFFFSVALSLRLVISLASKRHVPPAAATAQFIASFRCFNFNAIACLKTLEKYENCC